MQKIVRKPIDTSDHLYLGLTPRRPGRISLHIPFRSSCRLASLRWYSPGMRKIGTFVLFALLPLSSLAGSAALDSQLGCGFRGNHHTRQLSRYIARTVEVRPGGLSFAKRHARLGAARLRRRKLGGHGSRAQSRYCRSGIRYAWLCARLDGPRLSGPARLCLVSPSRAC